MRGEEMSTRYSLTGAWRSRTCSISVSKRAAERHEARQRALGQDGRAGAEEVLGVGVGKGDAVVRADHDHRPADRVQHDLRRVDARRCRGPGIHVHATSLSSASAPSDEGRAQRGDDGVRIGGGDDRLAELAQQPAAHGGRDTSRDAFAPAAARSRRRRATACPRSGRRRSRRGHPADPGSAARPLCPPAACAIAPAVHGAP